MRRFLVLAVVFLVTAAAFWWWWTLPPRGNGEELGRALRLAPPGAGGAAAVATPRRAVRWLARRPQALVLLAAASGEAAPVLPRLQPAVQGLVKAAWGPLVLWWQGPDAGVAAYLGDGPRGAFLELAARSDLAAVCGSDWCAAATAATLLPEGTRAERAPLAPGAPLAAFARVGDRWWTVRATRRTLEATTGTAPPVPARADAVSRVALEEGGAVLAWLGLAGTITGPVRLAADDHHRWAVGLPELHVEGVARLLLGGPATPSPLPTRWRGVGGELWVAEEEGTAFASAPAALALLPAPAKRGSEGIVYGRHAARLLRRAASLTGRIPGLPLPHRRLEQAAALADGLDAVRFRVESAGGSVRLAW